MLPRGLRNNNPGNLRLSETTKWQGQVPGEDREFVTFSSMAHGIRALVITLQTYRQKYGLKTVRGIISRWAPKEENDTEAYIAAVCGGRLNPDTELPDDRLTYEYLARRIALHENGKAAEGIDRLDWIAGLDMVFGNSVRGEAPAPVAVPEKSVKEKVMAVPALVWAAAEALLPTVIDLFRGHGGKTAERNANLLEKAGPTLVEIAKTVTGDTTMEGAVEKVLDNPAEFRKAVEMDLDKLIGMIERVTKIDDDSHDRATERALKERVDLAPKLSDQQFWIVVGAGVFLAAIAGIDMWSDGQISEGVLAMVAGFIGWAMQKRGTIVDHRFGSSVGSEVKNDIIAASRK